MQGAREYSLMFTTGQYGRLYLVAGSHARGLTFRIFVLPEGEQAKPNGENNPPLNADAVEVYGVTGGQSGWMETYGWLHQGRWQQDFEKLVEARRAELTAAENAKQEALQRAEDDEAARIQSLLATY